MSRILPLLRSLRALLVLALLTFGLSGCLQTRNEKIELQSEVVKEKLRKKFENRIKKTYAEVQQEKMALRVKRALPLETRLEIQYRRNVQRSFDTIDQAKPSDPLESFEVEREQVLNRAFTDTKWIRDR